MVLVRFELRLKSSSQQFLFAADWCTRFNFPVPAAAGAHVVHPILFRGYRTRKRQLRVTDSKARTWDAHNRTLEKAAQVVE
jgi:hypothetical protein